MLGGVPQVNPCGSIAGLARQGTDPFDGLELRIPRSVNSIRRMRRSLACFHADFLDALFADTLTAGEARQPGYSDNKRSRQGG